MFGYSRTSLIAFALAAAVSLAACGGDSKGSGASAPAPAAPAPATTTTAAPQTGDASGDVSPAGDNLAIGKRVVAPYVVYGKTGSNQNTTVGVTVLKVRKGKISDFKDFNLGKPEKNSVPYYIDVKYENLGKLKLDRNLLDPAIEDSAGQEYKPINLIVLSGTFTKCPNPSRSKLRPGQSFTLCAPVLLPVGKTYERVRFQGDVTKDPYFWK
ncbi:MAG: hypothetical protein QOG15_3401 [Solirubrobacteraceae bacterium]|nr:hypothetical protein [Solirubrobacteraceae bacterium]